MSLRSHVLTLFAMIALFAAAGCDRSGGPALSSETDEPYYRQGQQLKNQGRYQEALSAYLKLIARRGESAPEAHLEAGLIYLQQIKDPIAAIYYFRKYLELQPNSPRAAYVRGVMEAAKREFAKTLPAQPFESQTERIDLQDQIERLRRENELLKAEVQSARNTAGATPMVRSRSSLDADDSATTTDAPVRSSPSVRLPPPEESPITPVQEVAITPVQRVAPPPATTTQAAPPTRPGLSRPTSPAGSGRTHTVQKGDTLYNLAQRYYNNRSRFRDIRDANRDVLPSDSTPLRIGMQLKIP